MAWMNGQWKNQGRFMWNRKQGLTLAELKNASMAFDTASKEKLYFEVDGQQKLSENFRAMVNNSTKQMITAVSDDYNLLQHKQVSDAVADALLNLNITAKCSPVNYNNKMFVDITFPEVQFDMQRGEQFIGGVRIINSYDKSTGIMVLPQLMRVACNNGMVLATVWVDSINVRHTSKLVKEFESLIPKMIDSMVNGCDKFRAMVENCIGDSIEWETLTKILPELVKQDKWREAIADRLKRDHQDGSGYSRWELYNAITSVCTHEQQLRPTVEQALQNIAERVLVTPLAQMKQAQPEVA
jgi:hypothetical protein